jgi:maltose O-acetyltransferase
MSNIFSRAAGMIYPRISLTRLQKRGLRLGKNVYIGTPGGVDYNFCWLISIGDDCIISPDVIILAHDASPENHLGYQKIGKVTIGCRTYVGVGTVILPGVNIGHDVIIGAGSMVTEDIPSNSVVVGNPARVVESTSEFIKKHRKNLQTRSTLLKGKALQTTESKLALQEAVADGAYYVGP